MAGEHAQRGVCSKKQLAGSRRTLVLMLDPCKAARSSGVGRAR
jgi:hypothetical protein